MKTAEQLGIEPAILNGLIWVKQQLEMKPGTGSVFDKPQNEFDMNKAGVQQCSLLPGPCTTIGCIGAWAHIYANSSDFRNGEAPTEEQVYDAHSYVTQYQNAYERKEGVGRLFYPPRWETHPHLTATRTKRNTSRAIGKFLNTGTVPTNW